MFTGFISAPVGGALIFLAEGSADWEAQLKHSHSSSLAGRSLGNTVAGAAGAAVLAATASVALTTIVFVLGAAVLCAGAWLLGRGCQLLSS